MRVNVNFSEEMYDTLKSLAKRRGKSIPEVIRQAVAFEIWYQSTEDTSSHILVERDGVTREVLRT
jgi:predicted DNA-binding protein